MPLLKKILHSLFIVTTVLISSGSLYGQTGVPYGDNPAAGKYVTLNGVRHYYEAYGAGRPLLLIHGNSTGTKGWAAQIAYFSKTYRVYSVDCRGRGKSDLGADSLTFERTAADMAAFIKTMGLDSVYVLGKSDGAIVALLMGIYYPAHIDKIVAFAGNMRPDSTALYGKIVDNMTSDRKKAEHMLAIHDSSKNWRVERQRLRLDEFQPHITGEALRKINIPVLVMSCDRDVIKLEHTIWIYQNIQKANLCILPGETHAVPRDNPALFNQVTEGFFTKPFVPASARY